MDETGKRVIDGREAHYARRRSGIVNTAVALRHGAVKPGEEIMSNNEVEIWRSTAEVRAATNLADAQTRQMVAENSLGIVEQQQAEAHRAHERELELQKLANQHELDKMSTVDVAVAARETHDMATQRHDAVVALQKGWVKGLTWGMPIGYALGVGSGIAIGLLF